MTKIYIYSTAVICLIFFLKLIPLIKTKKAQSTTTDENYPYTLRRFLSQHEYKFYEALKPLADNYGYTIMSKVRIADIVEVQKGFNRSQYYSYFAKIQSKHVDFLLCDKQSVTPLLVVEIDDKSHNRAGRVKRDHFVDNLFKTVNLPIIHTNNIQTLENQVNEKMFPKKEEKEK